MLLILVTPEVLFIWVMPCTVYHIVLKDRGQMHKSNETLIQVHVNAFTNIILFRFRNYTIEQLFKGYSTWVH